MDICDFLPSYGLKVKDVCNQSGGKDWNCIEHYPQLPTSSKPTKSTLPAITTIIQTKQSSIAAALLLARVVMKLMQHRGNHIESELFATTGALFFTGQNETSMQCNTNKCSLLW